jgi:hypothetical protein
MPALEVPTMTLGARVEDVVAGETKRAPRPRKRATTATADGADGSANGTDHGSANGSAARRRRATTAPRVAPNTEDAG